jgi:two-component system response regulator FixJ
MNLETVFVVDDDEDVRDSLTLLLQVNGLHVETFASAEAFLTIEQLPTIACLVLDVRMQGIDGFQLQKKLIERNVSLPIIFITGHGDVKMAVKAIQRGAVDFLEKPFAKAELLEKINSALALSTENQHDVIKRENIQNNYNSLTSRESEVLWLLVKSTNASSKHIASLLNLSPRTVEKHRLKILQKMGVKSLPELVKVCQHLSL